MAGKARVGDTIYWHMSCGIERATGGGEMVSEINEAVRNTDYRASKMYIPLCGVVCDVVSSGGEFRTTPSKNGKMNEHVI
jgi:hypothetical protein